MEQKRDIKNNKKKKTVILTVLIAIVSMVVIYLGISVYFQYHFFKGTVIGNINVSFMTADEALKAYTNQARTYYLEIRERNGEVEHISAEDIGMELDADMDFTKMLDEQNAYSWLFKRGTVIDTSYKVSYNEASLTARFLTLDCLNTGKMTKPSAPEIQYSNGSYTMGTANPGTELDVEKTKEAIIKYISGLEKTIDLDSEGCYLVSDDASDDIYTAVLNDLNKYVGTNITLTFNDELPDIVIDSDKISQWISVSEKLEIVFDTEAIEMFVSNISKDIETMGQTRKFTTSYGNEVSVHGGDYGWWISESGETKAIIEDIKKGKQITREMNYLQKAAVHGENDLGSTYVEINLAKQHLFCYKDGELITECDIVSGAGATPTPEGIYRMRFMFKNYKFERTYFNRTVPYWMVFYGNDKDSNIGLVGCDWRNDFGGNTYMTGGSHGSIYVPVESAAIIYNEIPNDIPVIIYKTN